MNEPMTFGVVIGEFIYERANDFRFCYCHNKIIYK